LTGKLDAMTVLAPASGVQRTVVVNGPEDDSRGWPGVDWRAAEASVRRLRERIFVASQAGDLKRVRNLQKLMLRSWSNTLVSVRRVTELNAGRKTAGVDGEVELTRWPSSSSPPQCSAPPNRGRRVRSSGCISPSGAAGSGAHSVFR
jgi:RNA-directed DNA polymerase